MSDYDSYDNDNDNDNDIELRFQCQRSHILNGGSCSSSLNNQQGEVTHPHLQQT